MGAPPFKWTPEIEDEIFQNIAAGKPIRDALEDDWLPGWTTFNKRLASDAEFAARYARAREVQADKLFDECLQIADQYDAAQEKLEGGTDHINRARLRIDTRKWMAGKLRPKVYGDKVAIGGATDLPPIQTQDMTAADVIAARLAAIKSRASGEPDA
ncbi:MAG: hypothetical protein RIS17_1549 [Pseudomonadota bacterium]|jgi:hypothetical protein